MNKNQKHELRFGTYRTGGFTFSIKKNVRDDPAIEHPMFSDDDVIKIFNLLKKHEKNSNQNCRLDIIPTEIDINNSIWKSILVINKGTNLQSDGVTPSDAVAKIVSLLASAI